MAAVLSPKHLSETHRPTLDQALDAIRTRAYWSPHPEHPKAYGEGGAPGSLGAAEGKAAFDAVLHTRLDLGQPGTDGWTGGEVSPYGPASVFRITVIVSASRDRKSAEARSAAVRAIVGSRRRRASMS